MAKLEVCLRRLLKGGSLPCVELGEGRETLIVNLWCFRGHSFLYSNYP